MAPKLKVKPKELSVYAGDPLEIKADVLGAPQPMLKWLKDGSPVGKRVRKQLQQLQREQCVSDTAQLCRAA